MKPSSRCLMRGVFRLRTFYPKFSLYYNIDKTDISDKTDKLLFFYKSFKFFSDAVTCCSASNLICDSFPFKIFKYFHPYNPLHPLRNSVHPGFHFCFDFGCVCFPISQDPLFCCQQAPISCAFCSSLDVKALRLVGKFWIGSFNRILNDSFSFFEFLNICFCLFDQCTCIHVLIQDVLVHWYHLPLLVFLIPSM